MPVANLFVPVASLFVPVASLFVPVASLFAGVQWLVVVFHLRLATSVSICVIMTYDFPPKRRYNRPNSVLVSEPCQDTINVNSYAAGSETWLLKNSALHYKALSHCEAL